jgi:polysaccharide biosynthesis protein PelA
MFMRPLLFLVFSSFGTALAATAYGADKSVERYAVYYSDRAPAERFDHYQLLVLDRRHHPPLPELAEGGKMLLGYVSVGEIEKDNPYFGTLKKAGLVLNENANWKGSYTIDLRQPLWQQTLIEKIIPALLRDGFDGIFIDTLDSPIELERSNPARYKGMKEASIRLIQAMRMHYPSMKIMVNRAYPILPGVASNIDMVLGESLIGEYDFDKKKYIKVEQPLYLQQVEWLKGAKTHNPDLKVYTLDYADTGNRKWISEIYRLQRENGFIPYVASVDLDEVVDEPDV